MKKLLLGLLVIGGLGVHAGQDVVRDSVRGEAAWVRTICGVVRSAEDRSVIEGAMVVVKGGGLVSGSQVDGAYYIPVKATDSVLVFSMEGYETQEVRLCSLNEYNIVLRRASGFSVVGVWRGVFQLRPGLEVPFNFEIRRTVAGGLRVFFLNAEEQFDGGRVEQVGDSVLVWLDPFDNELAFAVDGEGRLHGVLRRQDGKGVAIAVEAEAGKRFRFAAADLTAAATVATPAVADLTGTYDIQFGEEHAVGLLQQKGSELRASFLRVTGDSRYLQGIVSKDSFFLSSFIGGSPAFYRGRLEGHGRLTGAVESVRGSQAFSGVANASAALPDPYKLTYLKQGYSTVDFHFPDLNGHVVGPSDEKYRGKVVIIAIGGSWCPNCIDEAGFLAPWYRANRVRGVEIISIQYERQTDSAYVRKVLDRERVRFGIDYDLVFGGLADKQGVAASLPALNSFLAFPTTIILDRAGKVAEIHTGYTGPATGSYYADFVRDFNKTVDRLLKG